MDPDSHPSDPPACQGRKWPHLKNGNKDNHTNP